MLNYDVWIAEMALYRGASKYTTESLERPSPKARGKGCSKLSQAVTSVRLQSCKEGHSEHIRMTDIPFLFSRQ